MNAENETKNPNFFFISMYGKAEILQKQNRAIAAFNWKKMSDHWLLERVRLIVFDSSKSEYGILWEVIHVILYSN